MRICSLLSDVLDCLYVVATAQQLTESPRARFTPNISSRPTPDLPDEGTFSTLPNGDQLETGTMIDPEDGCLKSYREVWRDLPLPSSTLVCFVQKTDPGKSQVDAVVARVGDWQMGVLRLRDGTIGAWRMVRKVDEHGESSWTKVLCVGSDEDEVWVTAPPLLDEDVSSWQEGMKVRRGDHDWVVQECFVYSGDSSSNNP